MLCNQRRDDLLFECLIGVGVPEKRGYTDEQILIECRYFSGLVFKVIEVLGILSTWTIPIRRKILLRIIGLR